MYKYLACDMNNIYWRSVCSCIKEVVIVDQGDLKVDIYSIVIEDVLKRLRDIKRTYLMNDGKMYLLFDNPTSTLNIRKIIDEEYKSPRMSKLLPKAFWDTLKILKTMLLYYDNDFILMYADHCEADDLLKPLLENLEQYDKGDVLLVSADMDWARGIRKDVNGVMDVHWFNFHKLYTSEAFAEKYKFIPTKDSVVLYKTFRGDPSDNIEIGLPNISEKLLLEIIEKSNISEFKEFRNYLKKLQSVDYIPPQWKVKIKENEERLIKNYQLVDFVNITDPYEDLIHPCKESLACLKSFFKILNLPLEPRMQTKEDISDFLGQQKYKRIRRP